LLSLLPLTYRYPMFMLPHFLQVCVDISTFVWHFPWLHCREQ
jgi:hypothetical protein